jgi:hypothetical protein
MKADLNYSRVLPRDLFNEAKLLNCMGRLCLLITDDLTPVKMFMDESGEPFKIGLLQDGSLTIDNLTIKINGKYGKPCRFKTTYNSRSPSPLYVQDGTGDQYTDILVFEDDGEFSQDFIDFCKKL